MNATPLELAEALIIASVRSHYAHGHGEIVIQIRPGSIRVREGKGHLFESKALDRLPKRG